jgi:hypothetical protein
MKMLISLILCSDSATKKGHLHVLVDAGQNTWERRWFVLKRYVWGSRDLILGFLIDFWIDRICTCTLIPMSWRRLVSSAYLESTWKATRRRRCYLEYVYDFSFV